MKLSVNYDIKNKPEQYPAQSNDKFENVELNRRELAEKIKQGCAICAQLNGPRSSEHFLCSGFIGLDFDEGWTLEEALNDQFIKNHAAIIYTTASHRKDGKGDKFRVIFELEECIEDEETHRQAIKGLLNKFPMADKGCSDAIRAFYGNENAEIHILEGLLNSNIILDLISEPENNHSEKQTLLPRGNVKLNDVKEMLSYIPPDVEYSIWRNICWAVANTFGEEGKQLIEEWSPDDKDKGRHLNELFRREKGNIKIGTLIFHASKCGYRMPDELISSRTEGQVAFEDVFDNGVDYANIKGELYNYQDGYYKKLDEGQLQHKVARYFNKYPRGKKKNNEFAKASTVKGAIEYAISMLPDVKDSINPPGINLKNGYLKLSYDIGGNPVFDLVEHSPDYYFTYRAEFDYNPELDDKFFAETVDKILDEDQQEIFFRVLGASLDLQEVRRRQGRSVRLLLLLGEGSNGKDTLREWIKLTYGGLGVTTVALQAFKNADSGKLFGLYPLTTSKINWPSESVSISFDHCQSLKVFVTGEDMTIEQKFKPQSTIKPKAIGIFNVNELPKISSSQESITSRYYILRFNNVFKKNHDESKGWEHEADSRLKEDEQFISENILPALLNRLIKGFKDILVDAVDYSVNAEFMQEVKEMNNHFKEFIREAGIKECNVDEGIAPKDLYNVYIQWCINEGIVELTQSDSYKYNDPHPKYDRIVRGFRQITSVMRDHFTRLQYKRKSENAVLGVKVTNEKYKALLEELF